MTSKINENIIPFKEHTLIDNLNYYKKKQKGLKSVEVNLAISNPRNSFQFKKNLFIDVVTDESVEFNGEAAYDNFINYIRYSFETYIKPFYSRFCNVGDVAKLSANINKDGEFEGDKCTLKSVIFIPEKYKTDTGDWTSYIVNNYRELSKLFAHLVGIEYHVQQYKMQKIVFTYQFEMNSNQTIKYLQEKEKINKEYNNQLLALNSEIERKRKQENHHTHTFNVSMIETEYGPRFQISEETTKIRIS